MIVKLKKSTLTQFSYIFFFIAITENRFMEHYIVLVIIYLLRFLYAVRGFVLIMQNIKKNGKSEYMRILTIQLIYTAVIITSGIINNNITLGILYSAFVWIGITNYIINSAKTDDKFIKTIDIIFKTIFITSLFLAVIFPDMMNTYSYDGSRIINNIFGGKNSLPMYLLMGLCINLIVYELEEDKKLWRQIIYPSMCLLYLYISGSGTGLITALVFMILFYVGIYKFLKTWNIVIAEIIIFFSVIIFRIQEKFLYSFIVDSLHRDITLTYRTDIWKIAIDKFLHNSFLGYGLGNNVIAENLKLPSWFPYIINETHNGFLDIALSLGIMGLIPFIILFIYIIRMYDNSTKKISQIMNLYIMVYSVIALTENAFTLSRLSFWSMLFIGIAIINKIPSESKEGEIKNNLRYKHLSNRLFRVKAVFLKGIT